MVRVNKPLLFSWYARAQTAERSVFNAELKSLPKVIQRVKKRSHCLTLCREKRHFSEVLLNDFTMGGFCWSYHDVVDAHSDEARVVHFFDFNASCLVREEQSE